MLSGTHILEITRTVFIRDIESFVKERYFYTPNIPPSDWETAIRSKVEEIKNELISIGYNISYSFSAIPLDVDMMGNLEKNNINLAKENKQLRHNISQLQKQINKLQEEDKKAEEDKKVKTYWESEIKPLDYVDYPTIAELPSMEHIHISEDGRWWR